MDLIGILLAILLVVGGVSLLIATIVYRSAVKNGNPSAKTARNITFIISFLVIAFAVFYIILNNLALSR